LFKVIYELQKKKSESETVLPETPKSAKNRKSKITNQKGTSQIKLNKLRTSMPIVTASLNRLNSPMNLSYNTKQPTTTTTTTEFTSLSGLASDKSVSLQLNNKLTKQVFSLPKMKNI